MKLRGIFIATAVVIFVISLFSISNSSGQTTMTLNTDRDSYGAGDLVMVTGNVSPPLTNQNVAVEVKDNSGQTIMLRTVTTDSSGNFALQFKIQTSTNYGNYNIIATSYVNGETTTQTKQIQIGSQSTSTPSNGTKSKCLIATAAFGSELAPQVQFLREFRDNHILHTKDGSSFMTVFNAWYYSFSPSVANYERGQPWLQNIVRGSIYPLLGILTLSQNAYSAVPGEYGSVTAGLVASSLIGAVYFWPFALPFREIRRETKFNYKLALIVFGLVTSAVIGSIMIANQQSLMITTSLFVLALIAIFATLSARTLVKIQHRIIR